MARPRRCKRVDSLPAARCFKPRGTPMTELVVELLAVDELEALRLADLEGLYHAAAAARMGVSRATFGRLLENARRTVTRALVEGRALQIGGGEFHLRGESSCPRCAPAQPRPPFGESRGTP